MAISDIFPWMNPKAEPPKTGTKTEVVGTIIDELFEKLDADGLYQYCLDQIADIQPEGEYFNTFVTDVRESLTKAKSLPESDEKRLALHHVKMKLDEILRLPARQLPEMVDDHYNAFLLCSMVLNRLYKNTYHPDGKWRRSRAA